MVSTIQIKPSPALQPYISCYALREFDSGSLLMPRPMHAVPENYMTFFLEQNKNELFDNAGKSKGGLYDALCNLSTQSQGCVYFGGKHKLFCIQFKSNGISAIFGIPQQVLINTILPVGDVLGSYHHLLVEQLSSCEDIEDMSVIVNTYLIKKLLQQKQKVYTHTIASCANIISQNKGVVSLDKICRYANMSTRTFERRFMYEVGMPAKLYARIIRFSNAMENKMLNPEKRWTDITYESGYFDQAHFIKECKEFSNKTPDELFKYTPPPKEMFILKDGV